jgi:hypothetical protein
MQKLVLNYGLRKIRSNKPSNACFARLTFLPALNWWQGYFVEGVRQYRGDRGAEALPEPAALAQEAIIELEGAIAELQGILAELGEEIVL